MATYSKESTTVKKATFKRKDLLRSLLDVNRAVLQTTTFDIRNCIHFTAKGEEGYIVAGGDHRNVIKIKGYPIEADDFEFAVPAKRLVDTISLLKTDEVTIRSIVQNEQNVPHYSINITAGKNDYTIQAYDPATYPKPKIDAEVAFTCDAEELQVALGKMLPFITNEEFSPKFNGANLRGEGSHMTLQAGDANMISRHQRMIAAEDLNIGLDHRSVMMIVNAPLVDDIQVFIDNTTIKLLSQECSIICIKMASDFPDVSKIIDQKSERYVLMDRVDLIASMKRMTMYSKIEEKKTMANKVVYGTQVAVNVSEHGFKVTSADEVTSDKASEVIDMVENNGVDVGLGFRPTDLVKILECVESDNVRLHLEEGKALFITPDPDDGVEVYFVAAFKMIK